MRHLLYVLVLLLLVGCVLDKEGLAVGEEYCKPYGGIEVYTVDISDADVHCRDGYSYSVNALKELKRGE